MKTSWIVLAFAGAALAIAGYGLGWNRRGAEQRRAPMFAGDLRDAVPGAPAPRQDGLGDGVRLSAALAAAQGAVAACRGQHVAVAVLDPHGAPKLILVPDGTAGVHGFNAWKKALTALYFRKPTSQVAAAASGSADERLLTSQHNFLRYAGGAPLLDGGKVQGAIGVSGARSEVDERCATSGAELPKTP